ncbi:MAG: hypothetical protein KKB62_02325 [Nanoarchaeota archaeon]|nr:hypothetical protein [Nanoarchaeota archaeon]
MLKEILMAGFLFGSVAFSQIKLEHNPKLDSVLSETYCWLSESKAGDKSKHHPSVFQWKKSEKKNIESILKEIPLVQNFESLKYPVYLSKGYTCDGISSTFPEKGFSEILLDTSLFNFQFSEYLDSVNVDIHLDQFTKQVLVHELTHVYADHVQKQTEDEDYRNFLFGEALPLAVECAYAIKEGLVNTKYFEMRRNALWKNLGVPEEFYSVGNEEGEKQKIKSSIEGKIREEDYQFLFE